MPVTFDAAGTGGHATGAGPLTWNHTVAAAGGVLFIDLYARKANGGLYTAYTRTVTVDGVAATSLAVKPSSVAGDGLDDGFLETFAVLNPAAGSRAISVGVSGVTPTQLIASSTSYLNVASLGTPVTNSNSSTNPTVTATSALNRRVRAALATTKTISAVNQTQRFLDNFDAFNACFVAEDVAGNASVTLSATASSGMWASIAVDMLTSDTARSDAFFGLL